MGARGVSPARVARRWPLPVILAALALAKAAALLVFVSGFLLTRVELPHRSRCGDVNVSTVIAAVGSRGEGEAEVVGSNPGGGGGCWLDASPVDKAVLLVIDGARFDFAAPASRPLGTPGDSTREGADASWRSPLSRGGRTPGEHEAESMSTRVDTAPPRSARLGSIAELIEADQAAGGVGASALFRFVADPPTTTQQRLKGLLTGGLPTFVDVRHSFSGATALTEDNVIGQAASAGRRVAMSGDDTWLELFRPAHFAAGVEPYPSFNVRDLDTVDDGVRWGDGQRAARHLQCATRPRVLYLTNFKTRAGVADTHGAVSRGAALHVDATSAPRSPGPEVGTSSSATSSAWTTPDTPTAWTVRRWRVSSTRTTPTFARWCLRWRRTRRTTGRS